MCVCVIEDLCASVYVLLFSHDFLPGLKILCCPCYLVCNALCAHARTLVTHTIVHARFTNAYTRTDGHTQTRAQAHGRTQLHTNGE